MSFPIRSAADLGAVIRQRRQARALSQAQLAACAGVSRKLIIGLEAGHARAEVGLALRVLSALDVPLAVPAPDTLWARAQARKEASRRADDEAIEAGEPPDSVAARSEAFGRALASSTRFDLAALLDDPLDPDVTLAL